MPKKIDVSLKHNEHTTRKVYGRIEVRLTLKKGKSAPASHPPTQEYSVLGGILRVHNGGVNFWGSPLSVETGKHEQKVRFGGFKGLDRVTTLLVVVRFLNQEEELANKVMQAQLDTLHSTEQRLLREIRAAMQKSRDSLIEMHESIWG